MKLNEAVSVCSPILKQLTKIISQKTSPAKKSKTRDTEGDPRLTWGQRTRPSRPRDFKFYIFITHSKLILVFFNNIWAFNIFFEIFFIFFYNVHSFIKTMKFFFGIFFLENFFENIFFKHLFKHFLTDFLSQHKEKNICFQNYRFLYTIGYISI